MSAALGLLALGIASAQDVQTGVTYVRNGERMSVESHNMRGLSDTASCVLAHPDPPLHNGFLAFTNETRGALKKLISTSKQPSAAAVAHAPAFEKRQ